MRLSFALLFAALAACALGVTNHTQVLILGGGLAGLSAAVTLANLNITNYTIVEAKPVLGGRLSAFSFGGSNTKYSLEAGANWVHGLSNENMTITNPIWTLVQRYNLSWTATDDLHPPAYNSSGPINQQDVTDAFTAWDGAFANFVTASLARQSNDSADMTARAGLRLQGWQPRTPLQTSVEFWGFDMEWEQSPDESSWYEIANSEYFVYDQVSTQNYLVHDPRGYVTIATGPYYDLSAGKRGNLVNSNPVTALSYSSTGVSATLKSGDIITADYAICTFPIGVLQSGEIKFTPALPQWKSDAINGFAMSTYTKIFLQFPKKFWSNSQFQMYVSPRRGYYTEWQSLDETGFLPGSGIIFTTLTDEEAVRIESLTDEEVMEEVIDVLSGMYRIPLNTKNLTAFHRPRWYSDPYARGSFSNWPASYLPASQQNLRAALGGHLLFAGEATSYQYFGYLQGAYLEGQNAAMSISRCVTSGGALGCLGQERWEETKAGYGAGQQFQKRDTVPMRRRPGHF